MRGGAFQLQLFHRTRLYIASGTKYMHVTEPITKDEIASTKKATTVLGRTGAGEIIARKMIMIMDRKGTIRTEESTMKRSKMRIRRMSYHVFIRRINPEETRLGW